MISLYNKKHTFLSEATSPHTINLILNLVYENVFTKEELLIVLYGNVTSTNSIENAFKSHGIQVLKWERVKNINISFRTLNTMSLGSFNSSIIMFFLENGYINSTHVNVLLQDDELDRWNKLYSNTGSLKVEESALIDKNVLSVLNTVDNYIIPYDNWGKILKKIVSRELNVIDAVLPFYVLDYETILILEKYLDTRNNYINKKDYKVLVFTKPHDMKKSFYSIINYLLRNRNTLKNKNITFGVWFGSNFKSFALSKILSLIARSDNSNIKIEFHEKMSHASYFLMLNDYNCLILQSRGGFSTAKYFAEKVGRVITLTDSPNDLSFKKDYGIDTLNVKDLPSAIRYSVELADTIGTKELYTNAITKKHKNSIELLKNHYKKI